MQHFLCGSTISNILKLLIRYGGVSPKYWARFAVILCASIARTPFSIGQRILFENSIMRAEINPRPLFIIGHWRSGTTYLHELLLQKHPFAYLSYLQALLPWDFLGEERGWRFILRRLLPSTRPMDFISLNADSPAEDSLALANMCLDSFYHIFLFPNHARKIFDNSVIFKNPHESPPASWQQDYFYLLKKISLKSGGKRLLLKDPAHTGQIRSLLELFPEAQFIYIKRSRDQVLESMTRMCKTLINSWALTSYSQDEFESFIPYAHDMMLRSFEESKAAIPTANLVEINYQELIDDPAKCLDKIAVQLSL